MTNDHARLFRSLHVPSSPLVPADAWDVASARIVEDAGAAAIATTSVGVAWSLGAPGRVRRRSGKRQGTLLDRHLLASRRGRRLRHPQRPSDPPQVVL
ncbi:isocitrate lyase/phosphoenolpyruvate mutase family protein [Amycolatopsis coloradensis]|uniref:isocitrate lyase/phosphoenolpyruvate mutase family protein n=1 Tax=Amycolatopsis coloradensis TaxID=76021 RepID=UPI001FC92058|nr:isocitrate lyase/phosphoenolpyruvate mutase family protein [Amycolatopsis coloradensis]